MDPIQLEESTGTAPAADGRRRMDELPPVRLVAVDDVRMTTPTAAAAELDGFYADVLLFRREPAPAGQLTYRAENARLRLTLTDAVPSAERDGVRPQGIQVPSLVDVERLLREREVEYDRVRGLLPGLLSLLLRDPAGNWVELFESPVVR